MFNPDAGPDEVTIKSGPNPDHTATQHFKKRFHDLLKHGYVLDGCITTLADGELSIRLKKKCK